MEDSGFDSGDRNNFMQNYRHNVESENSSTEDILNLSHTLDDVSFSQPSITQNFRAPSRNLLAKSGKSTNLSNGDAEATNATLPVLPVNHRKSRDLTEHNNKMTHINTCRGLQRKLELKVEKAKRSYSTQANDKLNQLEALNEASSKKSSNNLIPINRLPIPRNNESKPLVEYCSDNSEEEDISFFPTTKKHKRLRSRRQKPKDLDTFSIAEMTIIESESDGNYGDEDEYDCDNCDSQLNLELPPSTGGLIDKLRSVFCCTKSSQNIF